MKILVARHGQTNNNKLKIPMGSRIDEELNEEGIAQAHALAEKLSNESIDMIFSSSMKRAAQTAKIVSTKTGATIEYDERLIERDFGTLSGKRWKEMEEIAGKEMHKEDRAQVYDYRPFGGESAEQVRERVSATLIDIKERCANQRVLVVAHGGVHKAIQYMHTDQDKVETPTNSQVDEFEI